MSSQTPNLPLKFPLGLAKALRKAAATCSRLSASMLLNEESLTGSLLGALTTTLPSVRLKDGTPAGYSLFWIPYNTGNAENPWSEARIGADFSLLFIDQEGKGRFAMFQAKRSAVSYNVVSKKWFIDVRHIPGEETGSKRSQMLALVQTGEALVYANTLPGSLVEQQQSRVDNLSWIHYLAYGSGTPVCKSLSQMANAFRKGDPPVGEENLVEFHPPCDTSLPRGQTQPMDPTLFQVLRSFRDPDSEHWITLETDAAFDQILFWIPLMAVGVVVDKEAWKLKPNFRNAKVARKAIEALAGTNVRSPSNVDHGF
jgi:hypothetical protein